MVTIVRRLWQLMMIMEEGESDGEGGGGDA